MFDLSYTKEYYTFNELDEYLENLPTLPGIKATRGRRGKGYVETLACFDLESTSTMIHGMKIAFAYIWMLNINGEVIIGRTWDEFHRTLKDISEKLTLYPPDDVTGSKGRILPVYIHNEAFDWHFFRRLRQWVEVFATDNHKPIRALDQEGFEFRDSLILSGLPLSEMSPRCINVQKLVGSLDYDLIRTPETPLTDEEIRYCINDVRVLAGWINDKLDDNGDDLSTIPMTRTGYVRRDVRGRCFKDKNYKKMIHSLTMTPEQYKRLKQLFQGGFTHANATYSGLILDDVNSYDITSSYPTVICSEAFPMSKFSPYYPKDRGELDRCLDRCCCLFKLTIRNVRPRLVQDNPISGSKCLALSGAVINNGRVAEAESLTIEANEIDYSVYKKFYEWDDEEITDLEIAVKAYLPKPIIEAVLFYYGNKTKYKGVDGQEIIYAKAKEYVNAIYGMMVTDPVKETYTYATECEWIKVDEDIAGGLEDTIDKFNKNLNRFLFYPWGVWVTSYARRNLFRLIEECGEDYIYSDTDSNKIMNYQDHVDFINQYNAEIIDKIATVCNFYGIDPMEARPQNRKGQECPLGVWDDDGTYKRFKTLGAKRYMYETTDGELKTTVAGVSKKKLPGFLQSLPGDPFENFQDDLVVPPEHTGKLTHTYVDHAATGYKLRVPVTDYLGNRSIVKTFGGVHLEPQEYHLGMAEAYKDFIIKVQGGLFRVDYTIET